MLYKKSDKLVNFPKNSIENFSPQTINQKKKINKKESENHIKILNSFHNFIFIFSCFLVNFSWIFFCDKVCLCQFWKSMNTFHSVAKYNIDKNKFHKLECDLKLSHDWVYSDIWVLLRQCHYNLSISLPSIDEDLK